LPGDPYVYPGTSCLRNRAGIPDPDELARFEAEQNLGRLTHEAGYHVAWERLDRERNNRASAASLRGDSGPLQAMLDDLVEPLSPNED
jgi:hypothetical protein